MLTDSQKQFQERLLRNAEYELMMARAYGNHDRIDILQARVNSLKRMIEESEND